jgi:outer membrane protein assembly factor BamD
MTRFLALCLLALGCSSNSTRLQTFTADDLLLYAEERAAAGKWNDAARAYEQFVFQFPTHARYQETRFRLGDVYFNKKEYLTAAAEYARLADDFPSGELADDARWRVCESYTRLAPRPELDQEYTRTAIQHCQSLIALYPQSEFVDRARAALSSLDNKLAEKLFQQGDYYFKRNAFDSAIQSFEEVLQTYPTTTAAPKALLRLYEAYVKIGYTEEATQAKERLLRDFPESPEARRVKDAEPAAR